MADDVVVLRDEQTAYDDGTVVRVRLLRVPRSDRFEEGVKYALHYGAAGADDERESTSDLLEALDSGEDIDPESDPVLRVESLATFGRVLRETNLELLDAIAEHEPGSVRALARAVDRGPKEVLENLNELEDYGLVAFEENGRAKRPYLPYEEIDIDIQFPLPQSTDGLDSVTSSAA